jgi:ATP-dependent exoDNAse (exonuclease V) beta subunit
MEEKSVWKAFHAGLDNPALASELTLEPLPPRTRLELQAEPASFRQHITRLRSARAAQQRPSLRAAGVSERIQPADVPVRRGSRRSFRSLQLSLGLEAPLHAEPFGHDRNGKPIVQLGLTFAGTQQDSSALLQEPPLPPLLPASPAEWLAPQGPVWGDVVHFTLHEAIRATAPETLPLVARNALLLAGTPTDAQGEPLWLDELLALVNALQQSELWQRARAAPRLLLEVPFELQLAAQEWQALSGDVDTGLPEVLSGRIDLAFQEADGWVIADYKTDVAEPRVLRARAETYRKQVDLYAACWQRLVNNTVKERRLVFTAPDTADHVW